LSRSSSITEPTFSCAVLTSQRLELQLRSLAGAMSAAPGDRAAAAAPHQEINAHRRAESNWLTLATTKQAHSTDALSPSLREPSVPGFSAPEAASTTATAAAAAAAAAVAAAVAAATAADVSRTTDQWVAIRDQLVTAAGAVDRLLLAAGSSSDEQPSDAAHSGSAGVAPLSAAASSASVAAGTEAAISNSNLAANARVEGSATQPTNTELSSRSGSDEQYVQTAAANGDNVLSTGAVLRRVLEFIGALDTR
jgi:hypothetical protein